MNHTRKEVVLHADNPIEYPYVSGICRLGNLLLIVNESAYLLVPLYAVLLLPARLFYRSANCRALEVRDFLIALGFVVVFLGCYEVRQELFDLTTSGICILRSFYP